MANSEKKPRSIENGLLYYAAGLLLILGWLWLWFMSNPAGLWPLRYLGWLILALGGALIFMAIGVLRSKGRPKSGNDWAHSTALVDRGIYAVVRHPLYLGWSLMYVAVALLSQHWLVALVSIPGIACVYLISKREDHRLLEKYGDAYARYLRTVPAMNLPLGIFRLLRHKKTIEATKKNRSEQNAQG